MSQLVAILDFGSQYTQLIARRVREQNVFCRIYRFDVDPSELKREDLAGVILSGGPASVYEPGAPVLDPAILELGVPVLGICYGLQSLARLKGGKVEPGEGGGEYGRAELEVMASKAPLLDGIATLTPAFDKAVSAFIEDIQQRGLSDRILLVITGEFGRTPRVNKNGGRDHWGNLCPLVFVGGGLRMGQVVGRSDRNGSEPVSDPITSDQVLATIMHSLFDIGQLRLRADIPPEVSRVVTAGNPISELV